MAAKRNTSKTPARNRSKAGQVSEKASINPSRADKEPGPETTKRKKPQEKVQSPELWMQSIFNSIDEAVLVVSPDRKLMSVNRAAEVMFGYSSEELRSCSTEVLHIDHQHYLEFGRLMQEAFADNRVANFEFEAKRKNGAIFQTEHTVSLLKNNDGDIMGIVSVVRDISERRRVEDELRRRQAMLARTEGIAHVGSWEWDVVTDAVTWSEELFRMFHMDPNKGAPSFAEHPRIIYPEDMARLNQAVEAAVNEGLPYEMELRAVRSDGETLVCLARGHAEMGPSGKAARLFGSLQDITERKQAEKERADYLLFLENLERINRILRPETDIDNMMRSVLDEMLLIFGSDRAWLLYPCDPEAPSWRVPMERTVPEYPGMFEAKMELPMKKEEADVFRTALETDAPICFDPSTGYSPPEPTREMFHIRSQIVIAVHVKVGKPWLLGMHQCSHARIWNEQDRKLFTEISRRITDSLSSLLFFRKVKRSEEQLRNAQKLTLVGSWELDLVRNRLDWNDETYHIFEKDPQIFKATYEAFLEMVHPEDLDMVKQAYSDSLKNRAPYDIVHRLLFPDGRIKFVHERCMTFYNEEGNPVHSVGAVQDITDRKRIDAINASRLHLMQFATDHSLDELLEETLNETEKLTGSLISFYDFVDDDQISVTLQNWSARTKAEFCKAKEKGLHYDIARAGVWADCVHQRKPVIHNDYASLSHRKGMPPGHAEVVRELVTPVIRGERIKAVLGVGNKPADYTEKDVEAVSLLADLAWEIAERKRFEEQLRLSLKEKEVMLQEIHHRVKNNMLLISSLLDLQAGNIDDDHIRALLRESRNRINAMTLIHNKLYSSADLAHIDFREYLQRLVAGIEDTYKRHDIVFFVDMEPVVLDVNMGIPCGLIVNELVSNCLKHAFPDGRGGTIRLGISRDSEGVYVLFVEDNGIGFPGDLDFRNTTTLGLQLVIALTKQLRGTIELSREEGTMFSITFPGTVKKKD